MNENEAKTLIERFAEKQQGGHFACPRCGKMTMDAESVTRNALSRRATVHICDACGTVEALEDMTGDRRPLTAWAIVSAPENWRMRRHYSAAAWAREQYTDRWNDCPYFRDMVERGEIPADYIGRRTDVLGDQRCVDFDFIGQLAFEGYSAVILAGASGQSAHLLTYCLAD